MKAAFLICVCSLLSACDRDMLPKEIADAVAECKKYGLAPRQVHNAFDKFGVRTIYCDLPDPPKPEDKTP